MIVPVSALNINIIANNTIYFALVGNINISICTAVVIDKKTASMHLKKLRQILSLFLLLKTLKNKINSEYE